MALTLSFPNADAKEVSVGNLRQKLFEVTAGATDYTTGGYQPAGGWAGFLGMRKVYSMTVLGGNPLWAAYKVEYDSVADKLMVLYPTGGGSVPAAVGDPAIAAGATPVDSSAASGGSPLIAGRSKEVGNATDLSGLGLLRIVALGN